MRVVVELLEPDLEVGALPTLLRSASPKHSDSRRVGFALEEDSSSDLPIESNQLSSSPKPQPQSYHVQVAAEEDSYAYLPTKTKPRPQPLDLDDASADLPTPTNQLPLSPDPRLLRKDLEANSVSLRVCTQTWTALDDCSPDDMHLESGIYSSKIARDASTSSNEDLAKASKDKKLLII
jgi:hypothetical protein